MTWDEVTFLTQVESYLDTQLDSSGISANIVNAFDSSMLVALQTPFVAFKDGQAEHVLREGCDIVYTVEFLCVVQIQGEMGEGVTGRAPIATHFGAPHVAKLLQTRLNVLNIQNGVTLTTMRLDDSQWTSISPSEVFSEGGNHWQSKLLTARFHLREI